MASNVKEDFEADNFGPAESAHTCFANMVSAVGAACVPEIMPFLTANFASADWRQRDAAVMCLALMQKPLATEVIGALNTQVLPHVLSRITAPTRDEHAVVRSSAVFLLGEMLESHIGMADGKVPLLISALVEALGDEAGVARLAAVSLSCFVESLDIAGHYEAPDGQSTLFSPQLHSLISILIARADREDSDEHDLRQECYETISKLVEHAKPNDFPILLQLLKDVAILRLSTSLAQALPASADDRARVTALRESMVDLILVVLCAIEKLAMPLAPELVRVLLAAIQTARETASEAWYALGTLVSTSMPEGAFMPYADAVYPLLIDGLKATSDSSTCRACIMFIGDLIRNLGANNVGQARVHEIMSLVVRILADQKIDRALKPPAIDSFSSVGLAVEPYLDVILPIIADAASVPDAVSYCFFLF